jgi:hypothetical protein
MNLSGYAKKFGEGADAGPVGSIIERTRAYLQETGLKDNVAYVDESNVEVYVTTAIGMFVVSSDEERRYVARLTPWQDVSGCSLVIGPTPESTRSITVTIKALEATLTEKVGDSASPLIALFQECVKRSRPW